MKRTYIGELRWAIEEALSRNHDRNPHRQAQVDAALQYGFEVALSYQENGVPMPDRPQLDKAI